MSIRQIVAGLVRPKARGSWIRLEHKILSSKSSTTLARYLKPILIKSYLDRPYEVDIEVTSNCDADCIMCPRRAIRRKVGPMDMELFKKIVNEAVALKVREVYLNGYGEISILKNYQEYITYIRQKSRSIKININTNGMRMSEEMSRFYVESKVNLVNITIDGATAPTFEGIRRHLKLDVVESNVKKLIQIRDESSKKYPFVSVHMIVMPQNSHEAQIFLDKWKGVADNVGLSGLLSRIDSIDFARAKNDLWEKTPCFLLWNQMPILSDGTVALCCDDWDGQATQGNLNTNSIKEIWTSRKRQGLRSVHLAGKASSIPICRDCRQPRQGPIWFGKPAG